MPEAIADASAVLAVLLGEPERGAVVSAADGADFLAPACPDFEIGSALSTLVKRGCLDTVAAAAVSDEFLKMPFA